MPSCPGVLDLTRCRWCRVCDVVVGQAFERCTRERCPRCCVPFLATLPCSRATSMCPACFGSCSGVRVVVIVFRVRGLALVRRPAPGEWRGDVSTLVGVCCASAGGYQSRRCSSSSMRACEVGAPVWAVCTVLASCVVLQCLLCTLRPVVCVRPFPATVCARA